MASVLAVLTLSDPCGTVSGDTLTFSAITQDSSADASGTAARRGSRIDRGGRRFGPDGRDLGRRHHPVLDDHHRGPGRADDLGGDHPQRVGRLMTQDEIDRQEFRFVLWIIGGAVVVGTVFVLMLG